MARKTITVSSNLASVVRDLDDLTKKQVPYATAVALTRTAGDARDYLRDHFKDHFTVRGAWVAKTSIQRDKAIKGPSPVARVGSLYEPMADHVEGGEKTGKGEVGVPVWARRKEADRTRPQNFPGKLAQRGDFFAAPFSRSPFRVGAGTDGYGIFQRLGRRKGSGMGPKKKRSGPKKRRLRLWWTIHDSVQIKPDWPFEREVVGVVESEMLDHFIAALEQARATARPARV